MDLLRHSGAATDDGDASTTAAARIDATNVGATPSDDSSRDDGLSTVSDTSGKLVSLLFNLHKLAQQADEGWVLDSRVGDAFHKHHSDKLDLKGVYRNLRDAAIRDGLVLKRLNHADSSSGANALSLSLTTKGTDMLNLEDPTDLLLHHRG